MLGLYKHGYRAYEEVRDDPELPFSCRAGYAHLPPPLPQPEELTVAEVRPLPVCVCIYTYIYI